LVGYNWKGWYTAPTGGNEITDITLGSHGNIVLYPQYTPKTYSITLVTNSFGVTDSVNANVTYGEEYTFTPIDIEGHFFLNWYYIIVGNHITISASSGKINWNIDIDNLIVYAHYF
jgi:uncharacterized repeat protein (TIGR02543 family)